MSQSQDSNKNKKRKHWRPKQKKNLNKPDLQNIPKKNIKQNLPYDAFTAATSNITPVTDSSLRLTRPHSEFTKQLLGYTEANVAKPALVKPEDSVIYELIAAFSEPEKSSVDKALDTFRKEFGDKPINKHLNRKGQKKQWNTKYQHSKKNYKPKQKYTAEQTRRYLAKKELWRLFKAGKFLLKLNLHKLRFSHPYAKRKNKKFFRNRLFRSPIQRNLLTISNSSKFLTWLLNYKLALEDVNKKYTIKGKLAEILHFLITTITITKTEQVRLVVLVIKLLTWKPVIKTIDKSFLTVLNLIKRNPKLALNFIIQLKTQVKLYNYKLAINFPHIFWLNLNHFIRYATELTVQPKELVKKLVPVYLKSKIIVYYNQLRFKNEIRKYLKNFHFRDIKGLRELSFKQYCTLPNKIVLRFYKRTTGRVFLRKFSKGVRRRYYNATLWVPNYVHHIYNTKYFPKTTRPEMKLRILKLKRPNAGLKRYVVTRPYVRGLIRLPFLPLKTRRRQVQKQQRIWTKIFKKRLKRHRQLLFKRIVVWQQSRKYILQDYSTNNNLLVAGVKPLQIFFRKKFAKQSYNRFFANNTSVFKGVSTFALDLYNNYIDNIVNDRVTIIIREKKIKTSQYKLIILKFISIFKAFYIEKQMKRFVKKTPQYNAIILIKSFLRLSGYRQTSYINMQRWVAGSVMSPVLRFKKFIEFMRTKKSLFKVKLVFNKLFFWLYDQANTKYLLGSKLHQSFLQNHILRSQFIYKKNFKIRLVPTAAVSSFSNTRPLLYRDFYSIKDNIKWKLHTIYFLNLV